MQYLGAGQFKIMREELTAAKVLESFEFLLRHYSESCTEHQSEIEIFIYNVAGWLAEDFISFIKQVSTRPGKFPDHEILEMLDSWNDDGTQWLKQFIVVLSKVIDKPATMSKIIEDINR